MQLASAEQQGDGLGLGPPLVRTIAALHGGTVRARSTALGQGAEFELRLPRAAVSPGPPVCRETAQAANRPAPGDAHQAPEAGDRTDAKGR